MINHVCDSLNWFKLLYRLFNQYIGQHIAEIGILIPRFCFKILIPAYESVKVYIQIPEATINYLIDDVTMNRIEENDAWEEEANIRINEIRKSDVSFK